MQPKERNKIEQNPSHNKWARRASDNGQFIKKHDDCLPRTEKGKVPPISISRKK